MKRLRRLMCKLFGHKLQKTYITILEEEVISGYQVSYKRKYKEEGGPDQMLQCKICKSEFYI